MGRGVQLCFVVASPMTALFFLQAHIRAALQFYEVTVVAKGPFPEALRRACIGATLVSVGIERKISVWADLKALWQLYLLFRRERYDIVHSVSPKAGLLAMVAARIASLPHRVHTFTGQVWVTQRGWRRFLLKKIDCLLAALATDSLIDSPSQKEFLAIEGVCPAERATVIGHGSICGVDATRFHPDGTWRDTTREELGIPPQACMVLYLGRLNSDKGIMDLAMAFRQLGSDAQDAWLVLAGPDEASIVDEVRRVVPPERLRYVGQTDTPEHLMAAADLICLPSYREGFGMVLIEAAATGIPAVASRIYGITDAVVDGETGLLHSPGDISGLKLALHQLIGNSELRRTMGEKARIRALRDFSEISVTEGLMGFYGKIIH